MKLWRFDYYHGGGVTLPPCNFSWYCGAHDLAAAEKLWNEQGPKTSRGKGKKRETVPHSYDKVTPMGDLHL